MEKFRHEQKYICSPAQMEHLRCLLPTLLPKDKHQTTESYHVKSLYFDTFDNRFLIENLDGTATRKKYRLRRYGSEKNKIKLECKSSFFNLKQKRFVWLSRNEAQKLLFDFSSETANRNDLEAEIYSLKSNALLKPKIIIDYEREAFVLQSFNVRLTLDSNITAETNTNTFFNDISGKSLFNNGFGIFEIKYGSILPDYITKILSLEQLRQTSFSKYVVCRQKFTEFSN